MEDGQTAYLTPKLLSTFIATRIFFQIASRSANILEECTMAQEKSLVAIERLFHGLSGGGNTSLFGGVIVLPADYFKQLLPLSKQPDDLDKCLKVSNIWPHVERLESTINGELHRSRQPTEHQ